MCNILIEGLDQLPHLANLKDNSIESAIMIKLAK